MLLVINGDVYLPVGTLLGDLEPSLTGGIAFADREEELLAKDIQDEQSSQPLK